MVAFTNKYAPLKPSNLRILSGPLSPASPLTPSYPHPTLSSPPVSAAPPAAASPAPPAPLQWLWSCHLCHQRYPLGATRRCLQDGHFFCSGVTVSKRTGAMKKRIACASEFDYVGWKAWAEWRQDLHAYKPRNDGKKDCEKACAYPSECRWGKKQSVNSSTTEPKYEAYSPASSPPASKKTGKPRSALFLDKLIKSAERKSAASKGLLSPVEEEELQASTSPRKTNDDLPDLQFPSPHLGSEDSDTSSDDTLTDDGDSSRGANSYTATSNGQSEQPKLSSDAVYAESGESTLEQIIEYAALDPGFPFGEPSPTSPGRRNAWDWSIEVPDNMVLSEAFPDEERVVWEKADFFDVEMS